MAKRRPGPLRYRDLIRRLRNFGVEEHLDRGKGSHAYLIRPAGKEKGKGPRCPIRRHGSGDEIPLGTIQSTLRRLEIDLDDFWEF